MPDRRTHVRASKEILGELSMGEWFQRVLDRNPQHPFHRVVDHTWERMQEVYRMYGEVGYAEFLVHIALDYGLIPEWNRRYTKKKRPRKGRNR